MHCYCQPPVSAIRLQVCLESKLYFIISLKDQKEHERRTTSAPMPTDHELMLELNEGLKKGTPIASVKQSLLICTLSPSILLLAAAHSLVVMRSMWPPSVARSLMR
ncbi:hypothetical protein M9H77_26597 [Catharanthus roseus]|uniref:Uncharacterized protein n=1 Tax=Catharanthus roseus TaxID=4058 RepID=A0ACC0AAG7_CATRO|nr:hypothetical protein M9H77_26597 [Catharanthus roseus]